jgi:hypothetical protein
MSDTETEAVQAGAKAYHALVRSTSGRELPAWDDMAPERQERWLEDAQVYYDAMRAIIAREAIAGICRREGHREIETTTFGSVELQFRCGRCGIQWAQPRPRRNPCGPVVGSRPTPLYPGEKIIQPDTDGRQVNGN